jgi:hypothetical protein
LLLITCVLRRGAGKIYSPVGQWLQEGVLAGERDLQCPARRCSRISRCVRPYDVHRLRLCVCDLVPEAVRMQLRVGLLREGGAVGPPSPTGPGPLCHSLWIMLLCVDEVLDIAPRRLLTGLWVHGSK